jgi:hypothetical protein
MAVPPRFEDLPERDADDDRHKRDAGDRDGRNGPVDIVGGCKSVIASPPYHFPVADLFRVLRLSMLSAIPLLTRSSLGSWLIASTAEILVDFPVLPFGTEQSADPRITIPVIATPMSVPNLGQ